MIEKICKIERFKKQITVVMELQKLLEHKYKDLFYAVLVHGSVATNEIIRYSDFDGFLIVKDEFVNSKILESFKKESMKIIYKFDPLQHHGWFQIKESDLNNYPEGYLPVTTLEHAKVIYPNVRNITLNLQVQTDVDYKRTLINMLNQFERRDNENWRPNNMFQLKSVLSQVMLMPCLYYSAIYNDGIFKRESFSAVKSNFTDKEWMPIETATAIRNGWTYNINGFQKLILLQQNRLIRKIATRFFAPKIPIELDRKLDEDFYNNLMLLAKKIKKEIV